MNPIHRQLNAKDPINPGTPFSDPTGHGSLVAHIINRVAPAANLIPVKAIDTDGALSDVLAALYLAHASGPCDIINLSLSMSCDADFCDVCNAPQAAAINIRQLKYFFSNFQDLARGTLLVAAAGNNLTKLALPAAFDGMLAVGSYHFRSEQPISAFKSVPTNRYILGPDGTKVCGEAIASRPGIRSSEPMFGTSFAAAFVSGVAARVICSLNGGPCPHSHLPSLNIQSGATTDEIVLEALRVMAEDNWPGYNASQHGMGLLRLK